MRSVQLDYSNRLHPKLSRLERQFQELLVRSFDPETLIRLMKMEVETAFPGLGDKDQAEIVNIVLEHMRDAECTAIPVGDTGISNVVPFPARGHAATRLKPA